MLFFLSSVLSVIKCMWSRKGKKRANGFKFKLVKLELSPLEQELSGVISGKSDFHLSLIAHISPDSALIRGDSVFSCIMTKQTYMKRKKKMEWQSQQGRNNVLEWVVYKGPSVSVNLYETHSTLSVVRRLFLSETGRTVACLDDKIWLSGHKYVRVAFLPD